MQEHTDLSFLFWISDTVLMKPFITHEFRRSCIVYLHINTSSFRSFTVALIQSKRNKETWQYKEISKWFVIVIVIELYLLKLLFILYLYYICCFTNDIKHWNIKTGVFSETKNLDIDWLWLSQIIVYSYRVKYKDCCTLHQKCFILTFQRG